MTSGGLELIAILHGRERASYLTELKDLTGLDNLNVYSSELIKDKCYKNKTTLLSLHATAVFVSLIWI